MYARTLDNASRIIYIMYDTIPSEGCKAAPFWAIDLVLFGLSGVFCF